MKFVVFAAILIAWVALLGVMLLNRGKMSGYSSPMDTLLPVGATLVVWLCFFALIVFGA